MTADPRLDHDSADAVLSVAAPSEGADAARLPPDPAPSHRRSVRARPGVFDFGGELAKAAVAELDAAGHAYRQLIRTVELPL